MTLFTTGDFVVLYMGVLIIVAIIAALLGV